MKRSQSGFTLLEVMVSIALLSLVVVLLYASFSNVFLAMDQTSQDANLVREARQVTQRFNRELSLAYLSQQNVQLAGGLGDLGVTRWAFISDGEKLNFTSLANTKLYKDFNESDQAEIGYYLVDDPNRRGLYKLVRRIDTTLDEDPEEGGREMTIATGVEELHFRFYDANKDDWYDSWDTNRQETNNRLPWAVEYTVIFKDADKHKRVYTSKVLLRMAKAQEER